MSNEKHEEKQNINQDDILKPTNILEILERLAVLDQHYSAQRSKVDSNYVHNEEKITKINTLIEDLIRDIENNDTISLEKVSEDVCTIINTLRDNLFSFFITQRDKADQLKEIFTLELWLDITPNNMRIKDQKDQNITNITDESDWNERLIYLSSVKSISELKNIEFYTRAIIRNELLQQKPDHTQRKHKQRKGKPPKLAIITDAPIVTGAGLSNNTIESNNTEKLKKLTQIELETQQSHLVERNDRLQKLITEINNKQRECEKLNTNIKKLIDSNINTKKFKYFNQYNSDYTKKLIPQYNNLIDSISNLSTFLNVANQIKEPQLEEIKKQITLVEQQIEIARAQISQFNDLHTSFLNLENTIDDRIKELEQEETDERSSNRQLDEITEKLMQLKNHVGKSTNNEILRFKTTITEQRDKEQKLNTDYDLSTETPKIIISETNKILNNLKEKFFQEKNLLEKALASIKLDLSKTIQKNALEGEDIEADIKTKKIEIENTIDKLNTQLSTTIAMPDLQLHQGGSLVNQVNIIITRALGALEKSNNTLAEIYKEVNNLEINLKIFKETVQKNVQLKFEEKLKREEMEAKLKEERQLKLEAERKQQLQDIENWRKNRNKEIETISHNICDNITSLCKELEKETVEDDSTTLILELNRCKEDLEKFKDNIISNKNIHSTNIAPITNINLLIKKIEVYLNSNNHTEKYYAEEKNKCNHNKIHKKIHELKQLLDNFIKLVSNVYEVYNVGIVFFSMRRYRKQATDIMKKRIQNVPKLPESKKLHNDDINDDDIRYWKKLEAIKENLIKLEQVNNNSNPLQH